MHNIRTITDDLIHVGGVDRRLSRFENMFPLPEGIAYNSYVYVDEKICIMDAVDNSIAELYYENVMAACGDREPDYLWINHVEPDHCSTINGILRSFPKCKLIISQKGINFLKQFYPFDYEGRYELFKDGDELSLGKYTLKMIAAPNVHWPEVTMAYELERHLLFSADAFGSFKAPAGHYFVDEVNYERDWLSEARRYYCNIVGKQGPSVLRLFKKIEGVEIDMLLPLHGLVFRTKEDIAMIMEKYTLWGSYTPEETGCCIVYSSMYGNSALAADYYGKLLAERGVPAINIYDVSQTDISTLIAECFRFSHCVFFCNTYNSELYPFMDAFLRDLILLGWDNHTVALVHNMTWGGKGLMMAKEILSKAKNVEILDADVAIKSSMAVSQEEAFALLADKVSESVKERLSAEKK